MLCRKRRKPGVEHKDKLRRIRWLVVFSAADCECVVAVVCFRHYFSSATINAQLPWRFVALVDGDGAGRWNECEVEDKVLQFLRETLDAASDVDVIRHSLSNHDVLVDVVYRVERSRREL